MASNNTFDLPILPLAVTVVAVVILGSGLNYLFSKPPLPDNAPALTSEAWPIIGSMAFFTKRWEFFQTAMAHSQSGNFSFYAGDKPVIGVSGDEARKIFFESRSLGFAEGYAAMLGGTPKVKRENKPEENNGEDSSFSSYFNKRLVNMLKGNQLKKGLPQMLQDARASLDVLAKDPKGMTDPFDSIYRLVYQFTMRTVACSEIADNPPLLARTLKLYETVEGTATPFTIMYSWLPLPAKAKRTWAGAQLYMIFKKVVDDRRKEGREEEDALQYLMDQGDNITDIITFVLGALFAGQLNSGINAAWILIYLASKPYWLDRVFDEVTSVADRYCPDASLPLKDRLMQVPIEAWEGEFPTIDICLKESIRLQMPGTAFRRNITDHAIPLNKNGTEVIPPGAYVALAAADIHLNPQIYSDPDEWDPARYLPERAEDKKQLYTWMGWGLARHPCLGMRFAKLENNLIVAFFLAYFKDIKIADQKGNDTTRIPHTDRNHHTAHKPDGKTFLKYTVR